MLTTRNTVPHWLNTQLHIIIGWCAPEHSNATDRVGVGFDPGTLVNRLRNSASTGICFNDTPWDWNETIQIADLTSISMRQHPHSHSCPSCWATHQPNQSFGFITCMRPTHFEKRIRAAFGVWEHNSIAQSVAVVVIARWIYGASKQ